MAIAPVPQKDGTTHWRARVRDPDRKWYKSNTYANREDALAEEAELIRQKKSGRRSVALEAKATLVAEYWFVWSQDARNNVSEGWKISQDQMARDYIIPVIGHMFLSDVTSVDIGRVLQVMQERGRSPSTQKLVYSLMHKAFGDAVNYYEMLPKSPVSPKFHRPKVIEKHPTFLTPDESMKLLEFTRNHYLGPAIWLGLYSGLRVSEIQALRYAAIDFTLNQIQVRAIYNRKVGAMQEFPKQGDWALVPMVPPLRDYLRSLSRKPEDFVVQSRSGGMMPYETFYPALKRLSQGAGLPVVGPHGLRHSSTELWVAQGASVEDIRRLLNHSNASTTMRYIHRTNERLNQLGARFGTGTNAVTLENRYQNLVPKLVQTAVFEETSSALDQEIGNDLESL